MLILYDELAAGPQSYGKDAREADRALGASIAVADLILIPCTPSGLDIEATVRTLEIIDNVRARRKEKIRVILVPNRVDQRTLE
ncbi:MAG: hypothetical protein ACLPKB_32120, partial [Xanthobacteraceae bacterium]